jgi:acetolactate synthase-1/2/3 large subunit
MILIVIRNVFKHAEAERPEVVHIELPENAAEKETDAVVQKRGEMKIPHPNLEAGKKAASMIYEINKSLDNYFFRY